MNIIQAQKKAIRDDAADSAQFDLVASSGRARCQWTDADMGILTILSGPQHMVGHSFHISTFEDDDGFTVANYEVSRPKINVTDVETSALFHKLWTKAASQPNYEKQEWKELEARLSRHGVIV